MKGMRLIDERDKNYARLVANIWADEQFREYFVADPKKAFADFDIDVPGDILLNVVEDMESGMRLDVVDQYGDIYFAVPQRPGSATFSDVLFNGEGGGHGCGGCGGCFGCHGCRGGD